MLNQPPGKQKSRFKRLKDDTLEFFNLHNKNRSEVIDFCKRYIFPTHASGDDTLDALLGKDLFEKAISESKLFSEIANRIIDQKYTDEDVAAINERIKTIVTEIKIVEKDALEQIEDYEIVFRRPKEVIIRTKSYPGVYSRYWESLINLLFERQEVKRCANCSILYIPTQKGRNKFCSPTCKSTYSKRKSRAEKRSGISS
jgi:hypothetical protein